MAKKRLDTVISYLEAEWTSKEILRLEKNLQGFLGKISKYPNSCPSTKNNKALRKGLVDKNNYIVYRIKTKELLEIVNFRGTKQRPLY